MIVEAEPGRTSRRQPRLLATAGAGVVLALALAACSSSGKSSNSSSAGSNSAGGDSKSAGSACMAAAQSFLTPWDKLPSTLDPAYAPLAKKPETGKTVIKLVGPIPSDNDSYGQQAVAAQSVRWTAKKITFDGTVEDLNAKFEQAISQKPAAITLSGWPPAAIQKPLADAAKAGVVVGLSSVVDEPSGYPGYASNTNGAPTAKQIGELNAYQFMRASKCDGTAAIFNLPFPILKIATDSFNSTVKANCPDCKVSYNEIQTKDIGTPAATNSIVSKLQSSPSTKYVYTIIGNVASGLSTAINQAGLSGIKIFGQVPDENSIGALRNKSNAWWVDQNSLMNGWTEFDGILRAIDTGKMVSDNGHYPLGLLTPDNVGSGTSVPVLPTDYQTEFKKLWRVG